MNSYNNIAVVGAGPAGIMAAIRVAQITGGVDLFEKNASVARKLGLTGKGRCNLTNDSSLEHFLGQFGKQGSFLRDAFAHFFVPELMAFFEERGLKLKQERQARIFPVSDTAKCVVDILIQELGRLGVCVHLSSPVRRIVVKDQHAVGLRLENDQVFSFQKIILATGGASYPQTGSTGDGFRMAEELGHCVQTLGPGLVPLKTKESFIKDLQGLTLKNIRLIFSSGVTVLESPIGELLFTHFGVSGPLVLDLSAKVVELFNRKESVTMQIDLKPGLSDEELDRKLQREFQQSGVLKLKNYCALILPKRFIPIFLKICKIEGEKKCHQVTAPERRKIRDLLKRFPLTVKGTRPLAEAMVTHGGVSLKEIDPRTMASKKIKGLYFCGEVLDLAAASGGYNLQAAFSTGYLAGESAANSLKG